MLLGAVSAFAVALSTGNAWAGMLAGVVLVHWRPWYSRFGIAFVDQSDSDWFGADHFGYRGLSALMGVKYVGLSVPGLRRWHSRFVAIAAGR